MRLGKDEPPRELQVWSEHRNWVTTAHPVHVLKIFNTLYSLLTAKPARHEKEGYAGDRS